MELILVKHSLPEIVPGIVAREWQLSSEGRERCIFLAERLALHAPARIIASDEPKAVETGQILARVLGKPFRTAPNLHEHDRRNEPYDRDKAAFEAKIEAFFAQPDQRIYGAESASQACQRFAAAVEAALAPVTDSAVAIVAHGTVISLYLAHVVGVDGFAQWKRLGLPSFVVIDRDSAQIVDEQTF